MFTSFKLTLACYCPYLHSCTNIHSLTNTWSHVLFTYDTVSFMMCWFQWFQCSCVCCNWSFMICDRNILQHGHDITCSVCFKSYHLKCITIDHVVIEYIEKNGSTWYCSHCLINIFPFKNLDNEIDFMSTVNEYPLNGSLIYVSDKIVSYVEYNLRIQYNLWFHLCYVHGVWWKLCLPMVWHWNAFSHCQTQHCIYVCMN